MVVAADIFVRKVDLVDIRGRSDANGSGVDAEGGEGGGTLRGKSVITTRPFGSEAHRHDARDMHEPAIP